jgi:pyrroline-5-carboxylate reductase
MKIAFIGGGNMGEAMLAAITEKILCSPADVTVSDVNKERLQFLENRYGPAVTTKNREAAAGKDVVVLAVKPQSLPEVLADLKGTLESTQLVLSIVAGKTIASLSRRLGHRCIVRAMPNTPARIGYGVTGWTATGEVTPWQKDSVRAILGAMGKEIYFDDEKLLDMVTAVSGSGPAYLFLLAESLIEAAVKIGLSAEEASELVRQTLLGSAHLLVQSGRPPDELRRSVTSPGGTTEAALKVFEEGGFGRLVNKAVRAAYNRAGELGS